MSGQYNRKDHLYKQAKEQGYRSRAAYKLMELDKKHRLLRQGMRVLDLGCYPGGWLQIALEKVGPKGIVIGVDLREVEPVKEKGAAAVLIKGDILAEKTQHEIMEHSGGKVNLLLSDLSPSLTGIRFRDAVKSAELVECALNLAAVLLLPGGSLVTKIFPGPECEELAIRFRKAFRQFARPSLDSSRKTSSEMYFVGRDYVGLELEREPLDEKSQ